MRLSKIQKVYHNRNNDVTAIPALELAFSETGFVLLTGESGCGKTTLLNIIGGADTDYTGTIQDACYVAYVEQETHLFESLTVQENLMLANHDQEKTDSLLERFDLTEERNKKVMKLSNGQKKRVQIMQKLNDQPAMLLCDEPTAALDDINARFVLEQLKALSSQMCVVIASHERQVIEPYADRIIRMEHGQIIEDHSLHKQNALPEKRSLKKKGLRHYLHYAFDYITSRPFELLFTLLLIILTTISIYSLIQSAYHLAINDEAMLKWYYAENQIKSEPNEILTDEYGIRRADQYDIYAQKDVFALMDEFPEIIGYTSGWDGGLYNRTLMDDPDHFYAEYVEKGFYKLDKSEGDSIYVQYIMPPLPQLFLHLQEHFSNRASVYQMRSYDALPLLAGSIPAADHEIIITKDYADYILVDLSLNGMEELIGKEILFSGYPASEDRNEPGGVAEIKLKIAGVTSYTNQVEYQIFMNEGVYDTWRIKTYQMNEKEVRYDYVNYLLDPTADSTKLLTSINQRAPGTYSHFSSGMYTPDAGADEQYPIYERPRNLLFIGMICSICMFAVGSILEVLKHRQKRKENAILQSLGYRPMLCRGCEEICYFGLNSFVLLIGMPFLCDLLNAAVHSFGYNDIISYSPLPLIFTAFCVMVLNIVYKSLIQRFWSKKRKL